MRKASVNVFNNENFLVILFLLNNIPLSDLRPRIGPIVKQIRLWSFMHYLYFLILYIRHLTIWAERSPHLPLKSSVVGSIRSRSSFCTKIMLFAFETLSIESKLRLTFEVVILGSLFDLSQVKAKNI